MKQNLCLIGLLVISHTAFSMKRVEKLEQEKKEHLQQQLQILISYFNSAQTFELIGETDRALNLYNYIINTKLPESPELTNLKQETNKQIDFLTKKSN